MSKKRNRKSKRPPKLAPDASPVPPQGSSKSSEPALQYNPFKSLAPVQKELTRAEKETARRALEEARAKRDAIRQSEEEGRTVLKRDKAILGETVEMTEEELFLQAVDHIDPSQVNRGKFFGKGPDTAHVRLKEERRPSPKEIEALGPPEDPYHNDSAVFEEIMEMQGVAPIENHLHTNDADGDIRIVSTRLTRAQKNDHERLRARHEAIEAILSTAGPTLSSTQTKLLHAARKAERQRVFPTINIRGEPKESGLRQVELAIMQAGVKGDRFVRIVTGKGLASVTEPVLKRAVVEWCHGEGAELVLDYAPEIQADGNFASLLLHVRRRRRS